MHVNLYFNWFPLLIIERTNVSCHLRLYYIQETVETCGHVGTRTCVAGLSQQTCYALHHHASQKRMHQAQCKATLSFPIHPILILTS